MNFTSKQQQQNFGLRKQQLTTDRTTTKTRNNDNEEKNATTFQQQQQQSNNKSRLVPVSSREGLTNDVEASRLPLATTCTETSKRVLLNDINNNNSNNEKTKDQLINSLEFVDKVVQNFLLDKICWTCDNCHSVPLILWKSNNNVIEQQQLKQRHHHTSNYTHRCSSTILDNATITTTSSESNKIHEYNHYCRHKLCAKCLLSQNNHSTTHTIRAATNLKQQIYYTIGSCGYQNEQQTTTVSKCPYDDQPMQSHQIIEVQLHGVGDRSTTVQLAKELVFCLNKSQGCKKSMPLKDLEAHTKDCLYARAHCPLNCGENLTVKSLAMGHLTTCPRRPVNCDFCDEEIATNVLLEHKKVCPKRPVSCQFCQSNNLIQEELEEHYEICDRKSRPCRFNPVCEFTGTKDECGVHEKNWEFHIDLLLRHIINDNMFASKKNRITDIIAIMKDLDNETTSLKSQLDLVTIKLEDMYKQNEEAQELILELKKENEEFKRRLEEQMPASNKFNDELKSTREKLAKLETQQKSEGNVWRALVEVLRKEIEALKVTINPNAINSTSATSPIEKTIVASLAGPPQLTPIQQQTKPFPIPSTIFEQLESERDNYCLSPVLEQMDQQNSYNNIQDHTTIYSHRQKQQTKQQYLSDNVPRKELHSQSHNISHAHLHMNNLAGRVNSHSEV